MILPGPKLVYPALIGIEAHHTANFAELHGKGKADMAFLLGGHVTFTIKRSEFGMEAMIPDIADEVTVMVSLQGVFEIPPSG